MATNGDTEQAVKLCPHCKGDIPVQNFVMHEPHCKRNIELCTLCGERVAKTQKDEHMDEFHAEVACKCGKKMEKRFFDDHQAKECRQRMLKCDFCELELTFQDLQGHVEYCGSRTEKCEKCGQFVMKKGQAFHDATKCGSVLTEEKEEPLRRTIVVDVEIAPQRRETRDERRGPRDGRKRRERHHAPSSTYPDRGRSALVPQVQPDSTMLPVNVGVLREPAAVARGPVPTDDSDFAWQVAQDINGLSVYPEKIKVHHPPFGADEPTVRRGIESTRYRARPTSLEPTLSIGQPSQASGPRPLPETSLQHGLVIGQSFVVPEGQSLDELVADQLEWEKVYGGSDKHTAVPGVQEGPLSGLHPSEMDRQLEKDRLFAEQLQQESRMSFDSLGLSDHDRRLQEDAMRRMEREQDEKRQEERMADDERRRKQLEEDEALAKQLQEQMDTESSPFGFAPSASVLSRTSRLDSSRREDDRRTEERRRQEEERRRQRQLDEDERLARNMQFEWETDSTALPFGASDSEFSGSSLPYSRDTRRSELPVREGFRYQSDDGIDMGGREQSSRRSGLVDDEIRSTTTTGELGLLTCRHCDALLLPSEAGTHELTCSMKEARLKTAGSRDSYSLVRESSLPVHEELGQSRRRESPFGIDYVAPRPPTRAESRGEEEHSCIYCQELFPLSVLVQHKLQCPERWSSTAVQTGRSLARRDQTKQTGCPCSHCHKSFPIDELFEHERCCPERPGNRSTPATPTFRSQSHDEEPQPYRLSCLYCKQSVSLRGQLEHERDCPENPHKASSSMPTTRNRSFGVTGLQDGKPCQYCRRVVDLADLRKHQIECKDNIHLSTRLRRDLMGGSKPVSSTTHTRSFVGSSSRDARDITSISRASDRGTNGSGVSHEYRSSYLRTKQDPSRLTSSLLQSGITRTNSLDLRGSTRTGQDRDWQSKSRSPLSFGERQTSLDSSIQQPTGLFGDSQSLSGSRSLRRSNSLTSSSTGGRQGGSTAIRSRPVSPPVGSRERTDVVPHSAIPNKYSRPLSGRREPMRPSSANTKKPWH